MSSNIIERLPGVAAINEAVNEFLPVDDSYADKYHILAGAFIAGGAYSTEQTEAWLERSIHSASPVEIVGTLAVAALPIAGSVFFWRRGWRSQGELAE